MKERETYPKDLLPIIIDCGVEDNILEMSEWPIKKCLLKIPHDYIEHSGKHNCDYWRTAIQYQLLFFRNTLINR